TYGETTREEAEEYRSTRIASRGREAYTAAPAARRRSSLGWILPLALLAILLGSIWHWSTRPAARAGYENKGTEQNTLYTDQMRQKPGAPTIESLKAKYNSVFDTAREQGVQISSMTEQNGKLVVRGTAPSTEAADKVRDQIRQINPNADDIVLDLNVNSSAAPS